MSKVSTVLASSWGMKRGSPTGMSPAAPMSSKLSVPPTSAIQELMSWREPQRTGQLRHGAGAPVKAVAAHPQYEHEDELPEQSG